MQEDSILHTLLAQQCASSRCHFPVPVADHDDGVLSIDMFQDRIAEGVDCA